MARRPVRRPYERVQMEVRNHSERSTSRPSLVVLHDTESHDATKSIRDLESIGAWFDNPQAEASAHVCVDGDGYSARYVHDSDKAWHCGAYNSASLGIEQVGFASFTKVLWKRNKRRQLRKVAKYIAYWSWKYGIPIRKGAVSNGFVSRAGIVTHAQLGRLGGGHHDPGPHYPFWLVLRMARWYRKHGW